MEAHDLDRIRFVTRHYGNLQGLQTLIPLGSMYLGLGLCRLLPQPAALIATIALIPVLLGGELALMLYARSYYPERFGEVHPVRSHWVLPAVETAIFDLLMICYLWYRGAMTLDRFQYVFLGSVLLFHWLLKECHASQLHHLILTALLVGIAMPVHSPSGFLWAQLGRKGMSNLLVGGAWVLAGLLDHWQLLRTLGPRHLEDLAEEAA